MGSYGRFLSKGRDWQQLQKDEVRRDRRKPVSRIEVDVMSCIGSLKTGDPWAKFKFQTFRLAAFLPSLRSEHD